MQHLNHGQQRHFRLAAWLAVIVALVLNPGFSAAQEPPEGAELRAERPTVTYLPQGKQEDPLNPEDLRTVRAGDSLSVSEIGTAALRFPQFLVVRIFHNSQTQLTWENVLARDPNAPPYYNLKLIVGTIFHTLPDPNAAAQQHVKLVISTADRVTIESFGTTFLAYYDPDLDVTWVVVKEGEVLVTAAGTEVNVLAGSQTWVEADQPPLPPVPATRAEIGSRFPPVDLLTDGDVADGEVLPQPTSIPATDGDMPRSPTSTPTSTETPTPTPSPPGDGREQGPGMPTDPTPTPTPTPSPTPTRTPVTPRPIPRPTQTLTPTTPPAGTCLPGYVARNATPGDSVCVTPQTRDQAAADNAQAASRVDPNAKYGPDACSTGFVWREAGPGDHVCVTPSVRSQAAADNRAGPDRRNPGGGRYGPDTCITGYVWREAFSGDHVCVTPATRDQAAADNAQAASRVDPNAKYGPDACSTGFVWRMATPNDHVCVTPAVRDQTAADNRDAQNRVYK